MKYKQEYLNDKACCPLCGTDYNADITNTEYHYELEFHWMGYHCENCKRKFRVTYKIVDIEEIKE